MFEDRRICRGDGQVLRLAKIQEYHAQFLSSSGDLLLGLREKQILYAPFERNVHDRRFIGQSRY